MSDAFLAPQEETATAAIEEIEAELAMFDDWMERYQYIIEMGRKLPAFPSDWQDDVHRVPGCQSQVWLEAEDRDGKLFFAGASDAAIVQGLVALLLRVYSGRSREEILQTSPVFLHDMGLVKALSTNRGNGVEAMAQAILKRAAA
ncbi:SufE family protein [Gluconobacter cerinus]|uniref:SufE family protein n=1 Tax=Gluconobacter TaxID=441 RepID=UPI000C08780C|nr:MULTISPECIES: SufE family protein [Gluconobacter]MBM3096734.1 SufE family protein [Gluconobacter cerinus]MBS1031543.1 SufE family protein [Gluconobacter cerinus]MBS1036894.1 SufE family protein [Gluconobacter cerinus]MBS1041707.1 SufE family protein [Gluconobacter cerinus]MBS1048295.1 SufE family protein [Gluconobacter cerinus]